jgi:hypothetical protein
MKRVLILLLAVSVGAAACGDETTSTVDGSGAGDGSGGDGTVADAPSEPAPTFAFFADADGDGFGDPANSLEAESAPAGYVEDSGDCDDSDASIHPGVKDPAHDGIDQDCDGFFQWLPAESEGGGFLATWAVDTEAQQGDYVVHRADDLTGPSRNTLLFYDTQGRVTRSEISVSGLPDVQFEEFTYDDGIHVLERVRGRYSDPASPTITEVTRFVYAEGLKISGKTFRGDPASVPVHRSARWSYDDGGRPTLLELFSGDFEDGGTLAYSEVYAYEAGALNGLVRRDGTGAILFATVLTNDAEGRPLTYKRFEGDPADPATPVSDSRRLNYEGDVLTLYLDFNGDFDDPASELGQMFSLTYDDAGNLVEVRYYEFFSSPGPMAIVEWTYDAFGNPLSVTLPVDERGAIAIALIDEDPSLPSEPQLPSGPSTASNYFLAPFDLVDLERLPSLP